MGLLFSSLGKTAANSHFSSARFNHFSPLQPLQLGRHCSFFPLPCPSTVLSSPIRRLSALVLFHSCLVFLGKLVRPGFWVQCICPTAGQPLKTPRGSQPSPQLLSPSQNAEPACPLPPQLTLCSLSHQRALYLPSSAFILRSVIIPDDILVVLPEVVSGASSCQHLHLSFLF